MSLFERLNNKRYNLQEGIDSKGNVTPEPDEIAKSKSILRNIKKKSNKTFASGSFDPANQETKFVKNEKKKNLSKEISQRRTVQDRKQQLFNRQYDAYDDGDLGNPTQTKSSTATQTKTVKQSEVSKQAKDFTKKINKKRTGGFENVTGEGQVKYPKTRKDLIAKRAEYGIDSKGNISDAGVKRYAQKTKELSSGSNLPVTPTQKELDLAKKRAVGGTPIKNKAGKVIGTTTGKYGGKLPQVRGKNQPSLADVKAKIDAKNPTYTSPISGGKLPVKQVRDPDLKRMSPADRLKYKEIKSKYRTPRKVLKVAEPGTTKFKASKFKGFVEVPTSDPVGKEILKKMDTTGFVPPKPPLKKPNVFQRIKKSLFDPQSWKIPKKDWDLKPLRYDKAGNVIAQTRRTFKPGLVGTVRKTLAKLPNRYKVLGLTTLALANKDTRKFIFGTGKPAAPKQYAPYVKTLGFDTGKQNKSRELYKKYLAANNPNQYNKEFPKKLPKSMNPFNKPTPLPTQKSSNVNNNKNLP